MMERTYRIKKILNNNVVSAMSGLQEVIIVGMGVGFQGKVHAKVDNRKIEKVFELKQEDVLKTSQLVRDIPESMFYDMYRLIDNVSKQTRINLDAHAYVTLIDHINFAMERHRSGQDIKNLMNYDLQILYGDEFQFGTRLLELVNTKYQIEMPDDEIGFLTMHIVNGAHADIKNQSSILTDTVLNCLNIVRDYYLISLKLEEAATQRITIHIKMLVQRALSDTQIDFEENILYNVIEEFDSAYKCSLQIQEYIENRLKKKLNPQELVYLTIHLNRLEMMNKGK
ncbi:PRD domain-containing protein [Erysipelothrix aquatica]|uniref:PRD domain-containing protein n=1 Tax=Erysipelothrix aquatica TaxID=2683714 RepID=UPI00135BFD4D|nr:PRD domain-containing protein [Erysipelothrix aquatica]